ncbi:MAG: sugar phosphate isomerase/epimerase [Clostridia bacterium]|nr:sugar phosphate isomerase/epimerase [Clostridia bacterium]
MRVSTPLSLVENRVGILGAINLLLDAGFDALDMPFHQKGSELYKEGQLNIELLRECRKVVEARGAVWNQAHALFPVIRQTGAPEDEEYNRITPKLIEENIRMCEVVGIPQIVVHPIAFAGVSPEEQLARNITYFRPFVHVAKECGVRVLVENMWGHHRDLKGRIVENVCSNGTELAHYSDVFAREFDAPDNVGVLVDVGHTGLVGLNADDMIRESAVSVFTAFICTIMIFITIPTSFPSSRR